MPRFSASLLALLLLLLTGPAWSRAASDTAVAVLRTVPATGTVLGHGWRFRAGDGPAWARPAFDDRAWAAINPNQRPQLLPQVQAARIGWLRLRLQVPDSLRTRALVLLFQQTCASEVHLNALVAESPRLAYQGLQTANQAFEAVLTTDFDPALPPLTVLPQDLGRVLINLFTNALHALQQRVQQRPDPAYRPEVTATTQAVPNGVAIRIRDNGTGMSAQVQAKIFQPFFTTKAVGQGTGLGLSLSHDIVTTGHGGTMLCESEEGTGTEFIITLPL